MRVWAVFVLIFFVFESHCAGVAQVQTTSSVVPSLGTTGSSDELTQMELAVTKLTKTVDLLLAHQQSLNTLLQGGTTPITWVIIAVGVVVLFAVGIGFFWRKQKSKATQTVNDDKQDIPNSSPTQVNQTSSGSMLMFLYVEPGALHSWTFAQTGGCPVGPDFRHRKHNKLEISVPISLPLDASRQITFAKALEKSFGPFDHEMYSSHFLAVSPLAAASSGKVSELIANTISSPRARPASGWELQMPNHVLSMEAMVWLEYTALRSNVGLGTASSFVALDERSFRVAFELTDAASVNAWKKLSLSLASLNQKTVSFAVAKRNLELFVPIADKDVSAQCQGIFDCVGVVALWGTNTVGGTTATLKFIQNTLIQGKVKGGCIQSSKEPRSCSACESSFPVILLQNPTVAALATFVASSGLVDQSSSFSFWRLLDMEKFDKNSLQCIDLHCACFPDQPKSDVVFKALMVDALLKSLNMHKVPAKFGPDFVWTSALANFLGFPRLCTTHL